jgi:hypothetical protein
MEFGMVTLKMSLMMMVKEAMLMKRIEKTKLMESIMVMVILIQQNVQKSMKEIIPQKTKWRLKMTTMTADGGENQNSGEKVTTQHV